MTVVVVCEHRKDRVLCGRSFDSSMLSEWEACRLLFSGGGKVVSAAA